MTHVMAPYKRRRRLAKSADLHASERYDDAQPCSDLTFVSKVTERLAVEEVTQHLT